MSKIEEAIVSDDANLDLKMQDIEYDPTGQPNSQNAIDRAKKENLIVMFPSPSELFIDLDNEHSWLFFQKQFELFKKFVDENAYSYVEPSKSGLPKRHVTVCLSFEVRNEEHRITLQALLGSDRVRELLGYVQAQNDDPHPTLFLEKVPEPQKLLDVPWEILTDEDCPF